MISQIHFIRHGITEGIANRWFYGKADLPLTKEGIEELENFKAQGIYPGIEDADCYTSGMLRANQTFEIIFGNVEYKTIPDLREIDFGSWECKTFDELKLMEGFDIWIKDTEGSFTFPGGDSPAGFYSRVKRGLKELLGYHRLKEFSHRHSGKDAVSLVVCHGGAISACMHDMFQGVKDSIWAWTPLPGRGYTVFFEEGDPKSYKKI